jgi:hypothetical protein
VSCWPRGVDNTDLARPLEERHAAMERRGDRIQHDWVRTIDHADLADDASSQSCSTRAASPWNDSSTRFSPSGPSVLRVTRRHELTTRKTRQKIVVGVATKLIDHLSICEVVTAGRQESEAPSRL